MSERNSTGAAVAEAQPDKKQAVVVAKGGKPAPASRKPAGEAATAESMAKKQREISVSEFFAKNRHLLGFDNPRKALLTTIKEAVDNSLDACEEAHILPEISVEIRPVKDEEDRYRVIVEDNGPGIVKAQVGKIFGKLLYGSKFHSLRQSRGQQGIGISAAGMYGQLTTGQPMVITSRPTPKGPAHRMEIRIDTAKNHPEILKEADDEEFRPGRGTRVEIELAGKYLKGAKSSDEYIALTAMANPHLTISYRAPGEAEPVVYPRVAKQLPVQPREIKPHPHGVELGILAALLKDSNARHLKGALQEVFSRVSPKTAEEICAAAKLSPDSRPTTIANREADALHKAIQATKLMSPPTDCIVPIGQDLVLEGLKKQVDADFFCTITRSPDVYRGNPFLVEAGLAYGGNLPADELARVIRFANRVPLLHQGGACAITKAVVATDWRNYNLLQAKGALPTGPVVIFVHLASVWVPFTSESKEAVAHYPEVMKEIKLALQECGRKLGAFLNRRRREADEFKKRSYIEKYLPQIGIALKDILELTDKDTDKAVRELKDILEKSRKL